MFDVLEVFIVCTVYLSIPTPYLLFRTRKVSWFTSAVLRKTATWTCHKLRVFVELDLNAFLIKSVRLPCRGLVKYEAVQIMWIYMFKYRVPSASVPSSLPNVCRNSVMGIPNHLRQLKRWCTSYQNLFSWFFFFFFYLKFADTTDLSLKLEN